jgi:hypothetical protein
MTKIHINKNLVIALFAAVTAFKVVKSDPEIQAGASEKVTEGKAIPVEACSGYCYAGVKEGSFVSSELDAIATVNYVMGTNTGGSQDKSGAGK